MRRAWVRLGVGAATIVANLVLPRVVAAKTLFDYYLPIPVVGKLAQAPWGASNVQPRDQDNGLEDKANKYSYWDGRVVKAKDGKFHMFASRWDQSAGHNGWFGSLCVHAVSESNVLGPYVDKGLCYSDAGGKGHNVMAGELNDGSYFILVSETRRPAIFYASKVLDGPWTVAGTLKVDLNGFPNDGQASSNTTVWIEDNGIVTATARDGVVMRSTTGLLGTYKVQTRSVYANLPFPPGGPPEDPALWYSGCQYHIVYSYPLDRKAYHLTSPDGVKNWKNMGLAWDATKPFLKYTDGTTNVWNKIERPQVYLEDGHVKYFTFSVIDVDKGNDVGGDNHGSKVIVVPFDGVAFDQEMGLPGCSAGGTGGTGGGSDGGAGGAGGRDAGTGGVAGAGGNPGSGGSGAGGIGGADGGGTSSSGGAAGASAAGGNPGSGGRTTSGGSTSSGGASAIGTGGATGGSRDTGGASASGAGGATANSGAGGKGPGGAGGSSSQTGNTDVSSGCSCTIGTGARTAGTGQAWIGACLALAVVTLLLRKRPKRH